MNDALKMTTNPFQQNIYVKFADELLRTLLTENIVNFPVDLTTIFTVYCQLPSKN